METKAKKFSHKLLALFMAIVMGLTCFSGVITAFGADSTQKRYDDAVEYNDLAWNILSDEQVATALLDLADEYLPALKELEPTLAKLVAGADIPVIKLEWDLNERHLRVKFAASTIADFTIKLGSVDELLETIQSVDSFLSDPGAIGPLLNLVDLGVVTDLDLSSFRNMSRSKTSSCDIVRAIFGLIYNNNDTLVGQLLRGELGFGVVGLDIYGMLGGMLGVSSDDAKSNFAYNIVKSLLFNYTEWFTDEEKEAYTNNPSSFVYDDVLLEKMTVELLDKISVLVTYADGTTSATRRAAIDQKIAGGMTYSAAAASLGYDPNLIYSSEKGMENNVLLFAYGSPDADGHATAGTDMIKLGKSDNIADFGYQALKMGWSTVLKDTAKLVHVNYDVDRGHGSNFDNVYFYWASQNITGGWDVSNPQEMYSAKNVEAWAADVYQSYDAESPEEFLSWVQHNFDHERTAAADSTGSWKDIESNKIFNKLRYSPLVDYYFANTEEYAGMKTGPINLYLSQLGTPNTDAFFAADNFSQYTSLVAGFNDCLIAVVKDLFPNSANIGNKDVPEMTPTGNFATVDDAAVKKIASTIVTNALTLVQYVADAADENILKAFYINKGENAKLTEETLEAAIIPLFISCIGNVNLGDKLSEIIHPADWDRCRDFESIAYLCLREYLSYILPEKDYSGLVETKTDLDGNEYFAATLQGTLLPMARDAVVYVMDGYVPVTDKNGNEWRVEDKPVDDPATLLELLNSVICYYADNYQFKAADKKDANALGIASLFGICDQNGKSLINTGNTIWENIDLIANKLLPVLGTFQGTGKGNFDSEALLWNDIVLGMLDFGNASIHESKLNGGTNFIYRLLKFITAAPIQTDPIINVTYDFVYDFINALFGPRYSGQQYVPFPARTSDHPFDDLLQKQTLAGTGSNNLGAVQKWLNNFVEFSGFGYNGVSTYPDTLLPGLMFAVTAVNSFITLVPSIAEQTFKLSSVKFADSVFTGCSAGAPRTSSVTFKNESYGVNLAYVDGMENSVKQLSRYFVQITDATIDGPHQSRNIDTPDTKTLIAPGESVVLNTRTYYAPTGDKESTVYTVTITYNITDANGNVLYKDLKARDYQYLTGSQGWADIIYPTDRTFDGVRAFPDTALPGYDKGESDNENVTLTLAEGIQVKSSAYFSNRANNKLSILYPEAVVLGNDNLEVLNDYGIRVKNIKQGNSNNAINFLGMYYYDNTTVFDDGSNTEVDVNSSNAIPVFDKATGDLLRIGLYDYTLDGTNWVNGVTEDVMREARDNFIKDHKDEPEVYSKVATRTHIAYTFSEAKTNGMIKAYHQNSDGQFEYIYLQASSYNTLLANVTMRGPVDGFYISNASQSIASNNSKYMRFLTYDGSTSIGSVNKTAHVAFVGDYGTTTADYRFIVADRSSTSTIAEKLDEINGVLNNYRDTDLTGGALERAAEAIESAFAATSTPLSPETAAQLADKTARQLITAISASELGDVAYVPATSLDQIPAELQGSAYAKNVTFNGKNMTVYYADADFVSPIYTATRLSTSDVYRGADAAGMSVTRDENGVYRHTNTTAYVQDWNTSYETPYYGDTNVQATNDNGDALYNQVQFKHYNANGKEVRDADNWVVAIAQSSVRLVPNTSTAEDNRGLYTKANDSLDYTIKYVQDHIDTRISQPLLTDISNVRNNMNSANFDVVTYNKMTDLAKKAEADYNIEITYDYEEPVKDEDDKYIYDETGNMITETMTTTVTVPFSRYNSYVNNNDIVVTDTKVVSNLSSVQVEEYIRLFNIYMNRVVERGYIGDKLHAEIVCASGNDYKTMTAVNATYKTVEETQADGTVVEKTVIDTPAVITKAAGAADPAHGAWDASGKLVNEGSVVYSDETWNAYTAALANAINVAKHGTSDAYKAYASRNYFVAAEKENYTAQITDCYSADTALQKAEIALALPEAAGDGYNVSASLVVVKNAKGETNNVAVNGDYTVTVTNTATGAVVATETFTMSADNNTFNLNLPTGTYTAKIESDYSLVREDITINVGTSDITGPAIPIIACDFNGSGDITGADAITIYKNAAGAQNLYCDLNGSGDVTGADAIIIYACAAAEIELAPITIA